MNVIENISGLNVKKYNSKGNPETGSKKTEYKPDILDIFSKKVINEKDINDMVYVPRAIFKGYLCFTAGTALNAIAAMIKKNIVSKAILIAGSLISIYGTFNFVKPFLIHKDDVKDSKK